MSNITENRLNTTISAADLTAINTAIATISGKLPVASLDEGQRSDFNSIDVNNKVFIEDVITELGVSGTGIVPGFISTTNLQNDLALYEQADAIEAALMNLVQKVSDIKRICGHEGYGTALAVYRIYDAANQAGVPGAKQGYDKLKARFSNTGAGRQPDSGTL
ncbi:hypothetical protein HYN48_00070 [Flavobacterium magnum]|uniref:Uncharacterized protein n=1 Tax=Flavobacterium magnum TaxID=2162713 RepID=A0A2S0RD12_9FLAO|nr:hypothetical protein [Flavobacterium magnum]AWA28602.1 hypothetical protein HYN48_00070 [Flavobacterium magnum]